MTAIQINKLLKLKRDEKIELVQLLWDDIAKETTTINIPQSHKELVEHRLQKIQKGFGKFKSWEEIKKKYQRGE